MRVYMYLYFSVFRCISTGINRFCHRSMSSTLYTPPYIINLCKGEPSKALLEKSQSLLLPASQKCLSDTDGFNYMLYGPEFGEPEFLSVLEEFLTEQYQDNVDKNYFIETAGATNGLHLLSSTFFKPGDIVFAEQFSYFLGIQSLQMTLKLNLKPVYIDGNGINNDDLDKCIQSHITSWQKWSPTPQCPYWAMLYLVPQFQNPTGVCLSPERSKQIIQLARKYSLLVICDDVYNCLYFPKAFEKPPKRLFAYDDPNDPDYNGGHVVSNGSFSKVLAPGVRCGWMEAPERVKTILLDSGILLSGGALSHTMSGIITEVMKSGNLSKHIQEARLINQESCAAVMEVFRSRLPFVEFLEPTGGYFFWLKLPNNFPLTAEDFAAKCRKEKSVAVFGGKIYSVSPVDSTKHLRVAFSRYPKEELVKAAHLISDLLIELNTK